jgi:hypothetical protein
MPEASHPSEGPAGFALPLTPAERSLVTIAGRFANEMIAPIAERLERDKSALPASVVAEWIRLGLIGKFFGSLERPLEQVHERMVRKALDQLFIPLAHFISPIVV